MNNGVKGEKSTLLSGYVVLVTWYKTSSLIGQFTVEVYI